LWAQLHRNQAGFQARAVDGKGKCPCGGTIEGMKQGIDIINII
jgi:hypothetical protein